MKLPNRLFFTGVPGSRWSGIAQLIESTGGFDTTDRTPEREYTHAEFSGHVGAYFGTGMEFPAELDKANIDAPFSGTGCKLIKSHEWHNQLDAISEQYPEDWILIVQRPIERSLNWWIEAGGFDITYPDYSHYQNVQGMIKAMHTADKDYKQFAKDRGLEWQKFSQEWLEANFGVPGKEVDESNYKDIMVTIYRP